MRFSEAMKIVEDGGMVRREQWQQDWVIRLGKSFPIILIEDMAFHNTMGNLSTSDMGAKDWVEVKDKTSQKERLPQDEQISRDNPNDDEGDK